MLENLPDYPHARHLAEALWRQEGQARGAALIVGAGVSTMAQIASENTPRPPLWSDLTNSLKKRLYPTNDELAPADSLRLAQEFQSYFGQAALNEHLREKIADSAWFPSPTHKRLMQLPWADVLTTNYDTLLERAAAEILTPAYDLVKSATDLVHARQPRIVKLHGSIGDNTPLVLTEEDYRTYPSRNAAMVNLARQVFIENELCLLGFSGADPNFVQWTGWVRDQLQGSHRKIYLVGALRLSTPARRLLEERNIAPIDLTPLVQHLPRSEQHSAATAILLAFLEQSKPAPVYEWTLDDSRFQAFVGADTQVERDRLAALENLKCRTIRWREERHQYPGWVICPAEYRRQLAESCYSAGNDMLRAVSSLEPIARDSFLMEFVWRCRTALSDPSEEQTNCLEQFFLLSESAPMSSTQVECALLLLTSYRDAGNTPRFDELVSKVQRAEATPDQRSRLSYERALHARDLMRFGELRTLLEAVDGDDPMWKLRRAVLACDLNMWDYAREQWLQAKIDIGRREQADRRSIWVRSRRALLNFVTRIDWKNQENVRYSESRVRTFQDRISHCDPWEYVEQAREAIQEVHDGRQWVRDAARRVAFSPGSFKGGHAYSSSINSIRERRRQIQRWAEWAAIPNRFKSSSLPHIVSESLVLDPEPSLNWVLLLIRGIHGSTDNYLDRNFTRLTLVKLPKDVRDEAISILLDVCEYWKTRITRESDEDAVRASQKNLGEAMSFLGRLVIAADTDPAQKCLKFAFELAANNQYIGFNQYEALGDLFEGAISALPRHDADLALRCAFMPLPSELSSRLLTDRWPEPTQWLTRFGAEPSTEFSAVQNGRVDQLLRAIGHSRFDRMHALIRLEVLQRFELLSTEQKDIFGERLWSQRDQDSPQLPSDIPFRVHRLRDLPAPKSVNVVALVSERVFSFSKYRCPKDEAMAEMIAAASGKEPLRPTSSVAVNLLDDYLQVRPWLRGWIEGSSNESPHEIEVRPYWLGLVVGRALIPAMEASELTTERLEKLLDLMDEIGSASAVVALPYFAKEHPGEVGRLVYRVQAALIGTVSDDVACGAEAVRTWLCTDNLRACLSIDQILHLEEILLGVLTATFGQSAPTVVRCVHAVFAKDLPANADRLTRAVHVLLKRTQPEHVQAGTDGEAFFSLVRGEALRMAKTLLDSGQVSSAELQAVVDASRFNPLPEIRFALTT